MKVVDIAKILSPKANLKIVGIRPGEKIHEQMIGVEDAPYTYMYKDYFKILPSINNWHKDQNRIKDGKLVEKDFCYSSNNNTQWMTETAFKLWLKSNWEKI